MNEKRFYDVMGVVPEVPVGIYREVVRRTRRDSIFYRLAVAACLALAVGVTSVMFVRFGPPSSAAYAADSVDSWDQMIYAFEYVGGSFDGDFLIDNQIATYMEEGISND